MNETFLTYYHLPLINSSLKYYKALIRIMDYISKMDDKEPVIYIINIEASIYKIYDSKCDCVFICDTKSPDLLLNAVLNLMPKKIVLLNSLGKKLSRTLMLLFNCIEC